MIREKHRRERPNASSQAQPLASVEPAPRVARYIYILNRRNVVEFGKVTANTSPSGPTLPSSAARCCCCCAVAGRLAALRSGADRKVFCARAHDNMAVWARPETAGPRE